MDESLKQDAREWAELTALTVSNSMAHTWAQVIKLLKLQGTRLIMTDSEAYKIAQEVLGETETVIYYHDPFVMDGANKDSA